MSKLNAGAKARSEQEAKRQAQVRLEAQAKRQKAELGRIKKKTVERANSKNGGWWRAVATAPIKRYRK
jgi:hypothetical protein